MPQLEFRSADEGQLSNWNPPPTVPSRVAHQQPVAQMLTGGYSTDTVF